MNKRQIAGFHRGDNDLKNQTNSNVLIVSSTEKVIDLRKLHSTRQFSPTGIPTTMQQVDAEESVALSAIVKEGGVKWKEIVPCFYAQKEVKSRVYPEIYWRWHEQI